MGNIGCFRPICNSIRRTLAQRRSVGNCERGLAHAGVPLDLGWNASIAEWLAGIFVAPPTIDTIVSYRGEIGATLFEALAAEPGCAAGAQRMQSALNAEMSAAAVARQLAIAFTQLFDGVGGAKTVSLYESAYVGVSGRLFQAASGDMEKLLRQSDVSTDDAFREPSDHLSIELALLARSIRHDADRQAQAALLDDHLLVWVPAFADRCRQYDRTGFYAGAAQVLTAFLTAQRATLPLRRTAKPRTGVTLCRSN
jgi:TorA-specific chaperone